MVTLETKAKQLITDLQSMNEEEFNKELRRSLNHQIALQMGWTFEADYHPDEEEWDGWRAPNGGIGYVDPPDFLMVLDHFVPAIESYLAAGESDNE